MHGCMNIISRRSFSSQIIHDASKLGTVYGGRHTVTLIPGDGIGRELCAAVKTIFTAGGVPVDFEQVELSGYLEDKAAYNAAIQSVKRNKVALKGMFYTPTSKVQQQSLNVAMRKELDIFANVVFVKTLVGNARHKNVDFVVIRENTEGEYSGLEHQPVPGVIESLKVTTKAKSERIVKFAFDFAIRNGHKKVTCVHKANIMKLTDGLFLNTFREVAGHFSTSKIDINDMIVDNAAMQLVSKPQQFDVIVTPNLYGNIVSNIGAGLVGGPGFIVGYNLGTEYATFEPGARHVGKSMEGRNSANPTSMILSSALMLNHLGLQKQGNGLRQAVDTVLKEGKVQTFDMGGTASTTEFCKEIIKQWENANK